MLSPLMRTILQDRPNVYLPMAHGGGSILAQRELVGGGAASASADVTDSGGLAVDGQGRAWNATTGYAWWPYTANMNAPLDAISVVAWVRENTNITSGQRTILNKPFTSHNPPYYQWSLFATANTKGYLGMAVGGTFRGGDLELGVDWTDRKWKHVAFTWANSGERPGILLAYGNGRNTASADYTTGQLGRYSTNLMLWRLYNVSGDYFPGVICHVAVFPHRLSGEQIRRQYQAGRYGLPSGRRSASGLYVPRAA